MNERATGSRLVTTRADEFGKDTVGAALAARGVAGHRCVHFDFGERLRSIVARNRPDHVVSGEDIQFLRNVLEKGVLLEDKDFPLAERILRSFLAEQKVDSRTIVVLNGLPRHAGQAEAMGAILRMQLVICLSCSPETVVARISANTGGDRTERQDDDITAVRQKLAIYAERTAPLVAYFRDKGVQVVTTDVTADATPEEMWQWLERLCRATDV